MFVIAPWFLLSVTDQRRSEAGWSAARDVAAGTYAALLTAPGMPAGGQPGPPHASCVEIACPTSTGL